MTIESHKILFGKKGQASIIPIGKEFSWETESDGFGFWTYDEKRKHVMVLDEDRIGLWEEWGSERTKREKAGEAPPIEIIERESIDGFKLPSLLPGLSYELSWRPTDIPSSLKS